MKFIADNSLGFKAYASFGKNEITERRLTDDVLLRKDTNRSHNFWLAFT